MAQHRKLCPRELPFPSSWHPGVLGCADLQGTRVLWPPLLDPQFGCLAAMHALDLDLIVLPTARPRSSVVAPRGSSFFLKARGGPSFGSTACIGSGRLKEATTPQDHMGNDRRMWLAVSGTNGSLINTACLAFPPYERDGSHETELHSTLVGLENDPMLLCGDQPANLVKTLLVGDWDLQPSVLGGGRDPARGR